MVILQSKYYRDNREKILKQKKEYNEKNREKINKRQSEYSKNNPEKIKQQRKEFRKKNKDELNKSSREYYSKNKEQMNADNKIYRQKHKDKLNQKKKEWTKNNPEKRRLYTKNYQKNNPEALLKRQIKYITKIGKVHDLDYHGTKLALHSWSRSVKKRDSNKCVVCKSTHNLEAHHIKHQIDFPELAFDISNGKTLCDKCHYEAHGKKKSS